MLIPLFCSERGQALVETSIVLSLVGLPLLMLGTLVGKYGSVTQRSDWAAADMAWERIAWSSRAEVGNNAAGWKLGVRNLADRSDSEITHLALHRRLGAYRAQPGLPTQTDRPSIAQLANRGEWRAIYPSPTAPGGNLLALSGPTDGLGISTARSTTENFIRSYQQARDTINRPFESLGLGGIRLAQIRHDIDSTYDAAPRMRLRAARAGSLEDWGIDGRPATSAATVMGGPGRLSPRAQLLTRSWAAQDEDHYAESAKDFAVLALFPSVIINVLRDAKQAVDSLLPSIDESFSIGVEGFGIDGYIRVDFGFLDEINPLIGIGVPRPELQGVVDTEPVPPGNPNCQAFQDGSIRAGRGLGFCRVE